MIEVQGLTKQYGAVEAVKDVSFQVGTDQVLGFLGPNGAGKTTIMKIITGYHFPTEGTVLVDGISVQENPVEVKKRIGYLPETVPLYGDLTVDEYLSFIADARFVPKAERKHAIQKSLSECGLEQVVGKRIETLSKGYKQRVGLAQAILHDPPILILDEPSTGLDPNQIIEIRSLVRDLGKRKTVILSTHIMQEVEAVCSQVLIINEGRIAAQGRPEEIAGTLKGGNTWELHLKGAEPPALREKLGRLIGLRPGENSIIETPVIEAPVIESPIIEGLEGEPGSLPNEFRVNFSAPAGSAIDGERIFDWAVSEGLKVTAMSRKKLSLEDIFVKLTADEEANG